MKATLEKQEPATLTIEERIAELHAEIDALVETHVDAIAAGAPGVPRGVLHGMAVARAQGGSGCKCGVYSLLFGPKKT
jgi:hypothetical protein